MRLVTFKTGDDHAHIGVVRDSQIVDLTLWLSRDKGPGEHNHLDMVDFIAMGDEGLKQAHVALESAGFELTIAGALVPLSDDILLAPIPRPRKNVMCLGRNYSEHVAESIRAFNE